MSQSSSLPSPLPPSPDALPPEAARALAALLGEGRVVAHRPCFARLFGSAAWGDAGQAGARRGPGGGQAGARRIRASAPDE